MKTNHIVSCALLALLAGGSCSAMEQDVYSRLCVKNRLSPCAVQDSDVKAFKAMFRSYLSQEQVRSAVRAALTCPAQVLNRNNLREIVFDLAPVKIPKKPSVMARWLHKFGLSSSGYAFEVQKPRELRYWGSSGVDQQIEAKDGDKQVGYVQFSYVTSEDESDAKHCCVDLLKVELSHRRQGIGTDLLRKAAAIMAAQGCKEIRGTACPFGEGCLTQKKLNAFYMKRGTRQDKTEKSWGGSTPMVYHVPFYKWPRRLQLAALADLCDDSTDATQELNAIEALD